MVERIPGTGYSLIENSLLHALHLRLLRLIIQVLEYEQ